MAVRLKRVYEPPDKQDGTRILVDRIWPRGLTKDAAAVDLWLKDLAPSTALRKWFAHDPRKWERFLERYFRELDDQAEELAEPIAELRAHIKAGPVTLVYAAKDDEHNNAVALKRYLSRRKSSKKE